MVTGLMEDFPQNTHLNAEVLISYASLVAEDQGAETSWNWNTFLTYLLLKPGTNIQALEKKFPRLIQTYKGKALAGTNVRWKLSLQALRDIHLYSNLKFEAKVNGSSKSVFILSGVGVLILVIAWVNYINLTTAKAIDRAKEVGIRKVVGSQRKQLIHQFLIESLFLNSLGLLVAFSLLQVGLPFFEKLTGYDLSFTLFTDFQYWSGILLVFATGTVLAAFYPAWVLSGLKPAVILKGKMGSFKSGARLRKSLVVFQFAISLLLISGSLVVYKQIAYMQNRDLGMNIDQILVFKTQNVLPKGTDLEKSIQTFKQTLLQYPSIQSVTTSSSIPGEAITWATNDFRKAGTAFTHANDFAVMSADHDFVNVFDLQLLAGRFFVAHLQSDSNAVVINETALQALGFKNPQSAINEVIVSDDFRFKHHIIGVVKDFNQQSLKNHYRPIILTYQQVWFNNYYEVKINAENVHETITKVKATYDNVFPGNPFDYFFLDDFFNHQYKADVQFGKVFSLFTGLAIFIACLGLIGLASFTIIQRRKEIGVRKVLGASIPDIVFLLNKDLIKLILLGTFIAWPIAYWGMNKWLQNYAFRIQISYWFMLLPAIIIIIISLLAVSMQTIKAANANPVKSLRNE
jgi:putative ABC transport system permease protein